jgi:hypothetical protein
MLQLIQKLRPLLSSGAGTLYKHFLDTPSNHSDVRINALEKSLELQAALNETVEVQIKIVQTSLENVQKTLHSIIFGLIAVAIVAGAALAAAVLR